MEDVAKRLFRYFLPVERETAQGEKTQGRGLIAADRGSGEALTEELFHQLGRLPRPLYWFTGWAQGLACGTRMPARRAAKNRTQRNSYRRSRVLRRDRRVVVRIPKKLRQMVKEMSKRIGRKLLMNGLFRTKKSCFQPRQFTQILPIFVSWSSRSVRKKERLLR